MGVRSFSDDMLKKTNQAGGSRVRGRRILGSYE